MFEKFKFTNRQIENYYKAASRDFRIAAQSNIPEVIFKFCYDALLKLSIAVCAKNGLRIKSRKGHHIKLLNKFSDLIKNKDIRIIGNEMRSKRNWDLYSGGILISKKESKEYLKWTRRIFKQASSYLNKNLPLV